MPTSRHPCYRRPRSDQLSFGPASYETDRLAYQRTLGRVSKLAAAPPALPAQAAQSSRLDTSQLPAASAVPPPPIERGPPSTY